MSTTRTPSARTSLPRTRSAGIALAFGTACISGFAVFVNSYGVKRFESPTTYTTAKNLVAAALLAALVAAATARRSPAGWTAPRSATQRTGLLAVGVIGGGIPFILFFEGLVRSSSTDAAFVHKTLVVWVAILAVPLLGERIGFPHLAAIALLVIGQAVLTSDLGALRMGDGELMIAGATILWAVEIVVAKWLLGGLSPLTVGASRMAIGVVVLLGWMAVQGDLDELTSIGAEGWWCALATGAILAGYVVTWFAALARAQAVDVTAVLVFGAVITAVLDRVVEGVPIGSDALGLVLITVGAGAIALLAVSPARQIAASP